MYSSQPYHNMDPQKFIKARYSPIAATLVDPEVDKIYKRCGLTFLDLFGALGAKLENPIRVIAVDRISQQPQDDFFCAVMNDTTVYSQSFVYPDFENKDVTDPELSAKPIKLGTALHYPSKESMNPPWYKMMIERLFASMQFSDFDFTDLPQVILYVTASGMPFMKVEELRNCIIFPKWMHEFVSTIPIVHIVVYDGLLSSKPPEDTQAPRGAFEQVIGLCVRTRREDSPGAVDQVMLRNLFKWDEDILKDPHLCNYMSSQDFTNSQNVLKQISSIISTFVDRNIHMNEFELENAHQLKNRVKNMFKKKLPERLTEYLRLPWRRVLRLRLGSSYVLAGRYREAYKLFTEFDAKMQAFNCCELRLQSLLMSSMCSLMVPELANQYQTIIGKILREIGNTKNVRFILMVPAIALEFHGSKGEYNECYQICRVTVEKVARLWSGNSQMKSLILAMLFERWAGVTMNDRKSRMLTSRAAIFYKHANQTPHALRCFIWLLRSLPKDSWSLIYQQTWLEKATALCALSQWIRALTDCKELLSLSNLDISLHERVISQLWAPYNDSSLAKSDLQIRINSLLEVRYLTLIDKTYAEYWGFKPEQFAHIIKIFDAWFQQKQFYSVNRTIDSWYDDDSSSKKNVVRTIGTGTEIKLTIGVYNRYRFSVHLDSAVLKTEYEGSEEGEHYKIDAVHHKDIHGMTKDTTAIPFTFVPLSEGKYTVNRFDKNYWGYIDTHIDCGPLVFNAVRHYPSITMELENFPDQTYSWECTKFNVKITNNGDSDISEFTLVYDHPKSIVAEHEAEKVEDIQMMTIKQDLKPGESASIPLIFRATQITNIHFHFFAAIKGIRCAFAEKIVKVLPTAEIHRVDVIKGNDTANVAIHCSVVSEIDDLEVYGIINKNCHVLRTIKIDGCGKLKKGESYSFVALTADETDETVESWRALLMGNATYAVLMRFPGQELFVQKNLDAIIRNPEFRFRLSIPHSVAIDLGDKIECQVWIDNPSDEIPEIFIQPKHIILDVHELNKEDIKMDSSRWIGMRRAVLNKANGYRTKFQFRAFKFGVFKIPGFYISHDRLFTQKDELLLTQEIYIHPKDE